MPPPSEFFHNSRSPQHARSPIAAGRCHGLPLIAVLLLALLAGCRSPRSSQKPSGPPLSPTARASLENDVAYRLILEGKYADAEPVLHRALEYDDRFGPAHNNLGLVYAKLGRSYDAAHEYDTAARLMIRSAEPHNNLGLLLEEAGMLSDAADAFEAAHHRDEENPLYLANLARARVRRGDRGEEVIQLLESLQIRTNDPRWRDWARSQLLRLRASSPPSPTSAPTATRPATGALQGP